VAPVIRNLSSRRNKVPSMVLPHLRHSLRPSVIPSMLSRMWSANRRKASIDTNPIKKFHVVLAGRSNVCRNPFPTMCKASKTSLLTALAWATTPVWAPTPVWATPPTWPTARPGLGDHPGLSDRAPQLPKQFTANSHHRRHRQ
jgi:hypothetical protein